MLDTARSSTSRVVEQRRTSVLHPLHSTTCCCHMLQWIEEEIVEDTKEGTGVDPAKFAASLKSDDDAMSNTGSLNATSKTDSDSLDSISDKPSTPGAEGSEEPDKV